MTAVVFDTLRNQMWMTFYHIHMIIQAKVSLDCVNVFLRKERHASCEWRCSIAEVSL